MSAPLHAGLAYGAPTGEARGIVVVEVGDSRGPCEAGTGHRQQQGQPQRQPASCVQTRGRAELKATDEVNACAHLHGVDSLHMHCCVHVQEIRGSPWNAMISV